MEDLKRNIIKNSIYLFLVVILLALIAFVYYLVLHHATTATDFENNIVGNMCFACWIMGAFSVPLFYGIFSLTGNLADDSSRYRTLKALDKMLEANEKLRTKIYVLEWYEKNPDDGETTFVKTYSNYDEALKALNEEAVEVKRKFRNEFDKEFEAYTCGECEVTYATKDDEYVVRLKIRETTLNS